MLQTSVHYRSIGAMACAFGAVLTGLLISAAPLQADEYPVVFKSATAVRELGVSVQFLSSVRPYNNKCYAYGEGSYLVSISDAFLAQFRPKGFTVQSVYLGLVSETRYDPETGRRLPTYIITDEKLIASDLRQYGEIATIGAVTEELPLDLPDCFRNGTPYSDCKFRYGRKTGKVLSAAETDIYAQLGAALDKRIRALMGARGSKSGNEFYGDDGDFAKGFRKIADYLYADLIGEVDERLLRYSSASFWARSASFPRGYGYALDADGGAAPSVNAATLKTVTDGLSKSQISVEELRRRLNAR